MSVTLAILPTSGNITAAQSFCKVTVAGGVENTATGYSTLAYPQSPEVRYYLTFELGGEVLGRSYTFGVDADGGHVFPNYVFPESGSWTVRISKVSDDSSVATASVTVA